MKMGRGVTICLLVVVCLVAGGEGRHGQHGHRKRDKHHGHHAQGGHPDHDTANRVVSSKDNLEIHTVKIGWLNVPKVVGCRCRHEGAICIRGPDGKPTCVQKHHLKESARLFKNYHELKEKAEEDLNEVDPPHHMMHDAPHHTPHHASHGDAPHNAGNSMVSHQTSDPSSADHQHHPEPGKHHRASRRTQDNSMNTSLLPDHGTQCDRSTMEEMRRRLIGWFHLLHANHHHRGHHHHHRSQRHLSVKKELREGGTGRCGCLRSVMWEFRQLDTDQNHSLSGVEVKVIDNNDMEPCLHPYLITCDTNRDGLLSHHEWCCCFTHKDSEAPCYAKLDELESTKNTELYIPNCDGEGYYHKEQCSGGSAAQTCWCVTPTGSEIPGTRSVGRAHCSQLDSLGQPRPQP
ncbi:uncharacterized protein LOC143292991 [Babylonia areolata]|uniref:uncharacterized protein LOC143292991 n=1 Tax=Babylonia areolata TaxID=304850 RepID=UPI003FD692FF